MKKISKNELKNILEAIKKFSEETKKEHNGSYNKISNKDLLFYFLNQINDIDTRLTKVETTQKLYAWFFGITITIISVMWAILT